MSNNDSLNGLEIAIIGMSGRFPGAGDTREFWENVKNGVESIPYFSEEELSGGGTKTDLLNNSDYVKTPGGTVEGSEYFDADFFGYTAQEAQVMTPQTRVFHECCWEALEDAGYDPWSCEGEIGIFGGGRNSFDWQALAVLSGKNASLGEVLSSTLYDKDNMTFRVSYHFNLRGPSFSLNTACSTGLVAVHLACQSLLSGECEMALAGAAAITIDKKHGYLYREGDILSPDGHIRVFDARARGLVYSDGAGVVVLKSLEEANAHGDSIYAVIKGTAINNDGHFKVSYTAPSVKGQEKVIRAALCMAGVEPGSIQYLETHGTGTQVGDPIEIQALKQAFNSTQKHFCAVGSVKTNVGHMTEAAGIGGLIKTVLALKNRVIPPALHFEAPNPAIDFENSPFYVNTRLKPWEKGPYPRRAGVSSFARGGTNAHIVLEEAPEGIEGRGKTAAEKKFRLVLLSARTSMALEKMTENFVSYLGKNRDIDISDVTYTLGVGRKAFEFRRKSVGSAVDEIIESLSGSNSREVRSNYTKDDDRPVVFMFPGLGSQYVGMGSGLYREEPVFRQEMERCFEILKPLLQQDIKGVLYPSDLSDQSDQSDQSGHIHQTEIAQPLLFIFEYALARMLMKWGIHPKAMIGYSFGEYTAACLSGVITLEEALKMIVTRVRLINRVPGGAMLSVPLPVNAVEPLLAAGLSIAIDNGPSCIVAGPQPFIDTFEERMKTMRYMCMRLDSTYAIHSMMMDPIVEEFAAEMKKYVLREPQIPYISNVTGKWLTPREASDPGYWARHLRERVRFAEGIEELVKHDKTIFIEVGPGRDLSALISRFIDSSSGQKAVNLVRPPGKKAHDFQYLLNKIGDLWLYGKKLDWSGFYKDETRHRIPLPTYPFQRKRYTIELPRHGRPMNLGMDFNLPHEVLPAPGSTAGDQPGPKYPPGMAPYKVPGDQIEQVIAGIWHEMLGVKPIEIDDDFLELGGDSLKAITVLSRIHKIFNTVVPLAEFFKDPSIKWLTGYIKTAEKSAFMSIPVTETKSHYKLSSIQKRLFIIQQMDPGNVSYNLPQAYILEGDIDKPRMEDIFKQLIRRHESLRTSFEVLGGEPVQRIHEPGEVDFEIEFYSKARDKMSRFVQSFDLSRPPLIRARLIEQEEKKHVLMVDMHHIISDGVSNALFIQDFVRLYAGLELPALKLRYKDYSEWLDGPAQRERLNRQETFWLKELEGKLPTLNLPVDFSRTPSLSFEGNRVQLKIPGEETGKLKELAKGEEATMYMLLLAIFNVMLFKLSTQAEIVIGVDTAGRTHTEFEQIMGVFINTLVLRTFPGREKTFRRYLQEVKAKTLEIFDNQDYPFDLLADKLVKTRNPSRNPLFDVLFSYEHFEVKPLEIPKTLSHLTLKPYNEGAVASKLDMNVKARTGEIIEIVFEYKTTLFKESTIRRYAGYFKEIADAVSRAPGILLKDIKITHDLLPINQDIGKLDLEF